ncbi:hypothetical protein AB9M90_08655 [Bacillus safensis]
MSIIFDKIILWSKEPKTNTVCLKSFQTNALWLYLRYNFNYQFFRT